jgi:hypothetical protein
MDVTDIIDYNIVLLNQNHLPGSFFCLSKIDPTAGFAYDPSIVAGHTYPELDPNNGKPYSPFVAYTAQKIQGRISIKSQIFQHRLS